jgi:hypothetical protein
MANSIAAQIFSDASLQCNRKGAERETIPRHNEIKKFLARSICRDLSVPVPPGD